MPPRKKSDVPARTSRKPVVKKKQEASDGGSSGDDDSQASAFEASSSSSSDDDASSDDFNSSDLDNDKEASTKRKKLATKGRGKASPRRTKTKTGGDADYADEAAQQGTDDDDEGDGAVADSDDDTSGDERGRKVIGRAAKAPTTGLVPPGRLSQNTLDFMKQLARPENNDKDWFWRNKAVYQVAQKEWYAFIDTLIPRLIDVDDEIPFVKANDVAVGINRDVRFSADKTPYKRNLSMSISRSGRKGIFAHYHLSIMPGNRSLAAFGLWDPQKDELANIRASFARHPKRFRRIINHPAFVAEFGEGSALPPAPKKPPKKRRKKGDSSDDSEAERPKPAAKKEVDLSRRRNVFGRQDELKVAPKGYAKDDPNIDLLRLRSIAVTKAYSDADVVHPHFMDELLRVATIARPLIHYINEIVTLPDEVESDGEVSDEDEEDEE